MNHFMRTIVLWLEYGIDNVDRGLLPAVMYWEQGEMK